MDAVLRGGAIYLILLLLFRLTGKRAMSQVTTFDFVVLLIIGEATQHALLGEDFSVVHSVLVIVICCSWTAARIIFSFRFDRFRRITESVPVILVADGRPLRDALARVHLNVDDVMTAGRETHGLERLDQVKWAVLETSGGISIVPYDPKPPTTKGGERARPAIPD